MHIPSNKEIKTFSLIWSFIFIIIAIFPLFKGSEIRLWSIIVSSIFFIIAFTQPSLLSGFYKVWVKFGEIVGNIISKVIIIILFYGLFTPIAIILRLLGKDLLKKNLDKSSSTYWIKRDTQPGSLKNQF